MSRLWTLVAMSTALMACKSNGLPPGSYGVNLTIDLAPGLRSAATSAQLSVTGDETYGRTLALSAFNSDEARVQYVPAIPGGTLVFTVSLSGAGGQNIGAGSTSVVLIPGKAVAATISVVGVVPGGDDLAGGTDVDMTTTDMAVPVDLSMSPDLSLPPDLTPPPPKRVFVTSTTYTGNLGGLTGADSKCQTRAQAAALTGTYKAWLSDSSASPSTRFTHSTGQYVLTTGVPIANNWTALTTTALLHAININELGGGPPSTTAACMTSGGNNVWTDTREDGTLAGAGADCGGWTDPTGTMSVWGLATSQVNWSLQCSGGNSAAIGCGSSNALYCFEQ